MVEAVQFPKDKIQDIKEKKLMETFETNIYPFFYIVSKALPHMKPGDVIINTSSVTAYRGSEHLLDYSSTKEAIVSFARSLSLMLAEKTYALTESLPDPFGHH